MKRHVSFVPRKRQSVGLVSKLQPAGDFVGEIADEARVILSSVVEMTVLGQTGKLNTSK